MPIYEYLCLNCENKFEILQRANNSEKLNCPQCQSAEIRKLFSTFGFSSGGNFVPSTGSDSNCSTCVSKNCTSCG